MSGDAWSRGSQWARWDVHLHTPDTIANNQFKSDWNGYFAAIRARPDVNVLGVTDYFGINGYERVVAEVASGGLPEIKFVFPNIEFRTTPATRRNSAINLHILVDSAAPDHVVRIRAALQQLVYEYRDQPYQCTDGGLIALGQAIDSTLLSDEAKRSQGANSFRPDFSTFKKWYKAQAWLNENSLVAVSGGEDGPAGVRDDGWAATCDEIYRFSDIVFTGNPTNRAFWLGQGGETRAELESKFGGPKPCLHGSDAHSIRATLEPDLTRYCWIKAASNFDGLRQTLYEPDGRLHIGPTKPAEAGLAVTAVQTDATADWLLNGKMPLNAGLVSIIGPRGSGKTAFADLLAAACSADDPSNESSFLAKAGDLLGEATVRVDWAGGERLSERRLRDLPDGAEGQEVRYLSQQFVERLCSGGQEELQAEIEDVVFSQLDDDSRANAVDFRELRALLCAPLRERRGASFSHIEEATLELETVRSQTELVAKKSQRLSKIPAELNAHLRSIKERTANADTKVQKRYGELHKKLEELTVEAKNLREQEIHLERLDSEFAKLQEYLRQWARQIGARWKEAGLDAQALDEVAPRLPDDYKQVLRARLNAVSERRKYIDGTAAKPIEPNILSLKKALDAVSIEVEADKKKRQDLDSLRKALTDGRQELAQLKAETEKFSETRQERLRTSSGRRLDAYAEIFKSIREERQFLEGLYSPLRAHLDERDAHEKALDFFVRCHVEVSKWLARGERLFDLRKAKFASREGGLNGVVAEHLLAAWEGCDAEKARAGIGSLLEAIKDDVPRNLRSGVSLTDVARWVFSTDHIRLAYGLRYDRVSLDKLSPGTKGIALLLLYLAVDQDDQRPLVIDQPEENLDPKSVYDRLVPYFRDAKARRQIILVTHNPNLVVNTDSDQVIVASAEPRGEGMLPRITYVAGGLEEPTIRNAVCDILEGGTLAFQDRERKYRLRNLRLP